MKEAEYLIELLELSEQDVVQAFLRAFIPIQPGVLRANLMKKNPAITMAPATKVIWGKFIEADYKCTLCGSRRRITIDHLDGDETNHLRQNLRVVCYNCHRKDSLNVLDGETATLRIFRAFVRLHAELGRTPTDQEIKKAARVSQIGGATYLLKFLREMVRRKENAAKDNGLRRPVDAPMTSSTRSM